MHIIIDGYNVLKQAVHNGLISPMQRRAFINELGKYAIKKSHRVTIVFDGGPDLRPTQEKDHGVTVIYSGVKCSADDLIKQAVREKTRNLLIVTSDNEIKAVAARQGIVVIDALEFYTLLKQEMKPAQELGYNSEIIKTSTEENALVDILMRQDLSPMYKLDSDESEQRQSKGSKLSKKERAYAQKIKKL